MKKRSMFLSLLLLACLLLPACAERNEPQPPPPSAVAPDPPPAQPAEEPIALEALTLEVVVEAGEADALLPQLEALSSLLGEALLERGYAPEQVTVTIGTAGGITAPAAWTRPACRRRTIWRQRGPGPSWSRTRRSAPTWRRWAQGGRSWTAAFAPPWPGP